MNRQWQEFKKAPGLYFRFINGKLELLGRYDRDPSQWAQIAGEIKAQWEIENLREKPALDEGLQGNLFSDEDHELAGKLRTLPLLRPEKPLRPHKRRSA